MGGSRSSARGRLPGDHPLSPSNRFRELAERQLALFREDEAELLAEVEEALEAYDGASRDEAEERYGEFVDLVDTGREALVDMRDAFADSLDISGSAQEISERILAVHWKPIDDALVLAVRYVGVRP